MVTRTLMILALCAACTGGERRLLGADNAGVDERGGEAPNARSVSAEVPLEAEPFASEFEARAVLAERFRQAGFRIRYDVTLVIDGDIEVTVDGYDPASKIGFEYVAADERETDLSAAERSALEGRAEHRILIVDAAPLGRVGERADEFLTAARSTGPGG